MLLRARWILPVEGPPLENGSVVIDGERIRWIGPQNALPFQVPEQHDLGEAVVLPGLINAHAHTEHGPVSLSPKSISFADWARVVSSRETSSSNDSYSRLIRGGTTTVVDHRHPEAVKKPDGFSLRLIPLWEVLGAEKGRAEAAYLRAKEQFEKHGGLVSPHSLYAIHAGVLTRILKTQAGPHFIHLLESKDEDDFFRLGSGPLADYVRERGGTVPFPSTSPVRWLAEQGFLNSDTRVVHGNYLNDEEIRLLQAHGSGVIHCPGSHRYFGHRPFPLEEFRKCGVPVGLGTDSLASNDDLSMLREMRLLKDNHPSLPGADILKMATVDGAGLIGLRREIGSLEPGKKADLIAVRLSGKNDPYDAILNAENVLFSMVNGQCIPL